MKLGMPASPVEILRYEHERILQKWEERARNEIDAARTQGKTALRDHLPNFLRRLEQALSPKSPVENAADGTTVCETHGKERADLLQYSVPQVLQEYNLLRQVVLESLEAKNPLTREERDILLASFDAAGRDAAEAFMDERTERERAKRRRVESERDQSQSQLARLKVDSAMEKTFVATLTHDLRNPIASVRMALDMLMEIVPSNDEVAEISDIMNRNLHHAETMVLDLLDANRLKSGHKLMLDVDACDLTQVAKVLVTEFQAMHGHGCILKAGESIRGFWSADRLRRVIRNLIDNAVKYGNADRPVTLSLQQDAERTTIAVHNEGNPISSDELPHIFDLHYQASSKTSHSQIGWGLGLTLVKGVAEAHGGTVRVESNDQDGTTFFVIIPNDARPKAERGPRQ